MVAGSSMCSESNAASALRRSASLSPSFAPLSFAMEAGAMSGRIEQRADEDGARDARQVRRQPSGEGVTDPAYLHRAEIDGEHVECRLRRTLEEIGRASCRERVCQYV